LKLKSVMLSNKNPRLKYEYLNSPVPKTIRQHLFSEAVSEDGDTTFLNLRFLYAHDTHQFLVHISLLLPVEDRRLSAHTAKIVALKPSTGSAHSVPKHQSAPATWRELAESIDFDPVVEAEALTEEVGMTEPQAELVRHIVDEAVDIVRTLEVEAAAVVAAVGLGEVAPVVVGLSRVYCYQQVS
jgi:hypothetical protein